MLPSLLTEAPDDCRLNVGLGFIRCALSRDVAYHNFNAAHQRKGHPIEQSRTRQKHAVRSVLDANVQADVLQSRADVRDPQSKSIKAPACRLRRVEILLPLG